MDLHTATPRDQHRYARCVECGEQVRNYVTDCQQHHNCEVVEVGCPNGHDLFPPEHHR